MDGHASTGLDYGWMRQGGLPWDKRRPAVFVTATNGSDQAHQTGLTGWGIVL